MDLLVNETPFHTYNGIKENTSASSEGIKESHKHILKERLPGTRGRSKYISKIWYKTATPSLLGRCVLPHIPLGVAQGHPENWGPSSIPSPVCFLGHQRPVRLSCTGDPWPQAPEASGASRKGTFSVRCPQATLGSISFHARHGTLHGSRGKREMHFSGRGKGGKEDSIPILQVRKLRLK